MPFIFDDEKKLREAAKDVTAGLKSIEPTKATLDNAASARKTAGQNMVNSATNFVQQAPKNNNNNYRYVSAGGGANPNQQYIDQLQDIYSQIMNRGPFAYDLEGDMFYRQYADQYSQLGQQAMRDTMAQSAALTGGYGNSWASAAAQQANQQYLNQLNSMIPEFYDRAYNAWLNEGDELLNQYNLAASHPGVIDSLKPRSGGGYVVKNSGSNDNSAYIQQLVKQFGNSATGSAAGSLPESSVLDAALAMTNTVNSKTGQPDSDYYNLIKRYTK